MAQSGFLKSNQVAEKAGFAFPPSYRSTGGGRNFQEIGVFLQPQGLP
jgi:hypothetical protein